MIISHATAMDLRKNLGEVLNGVQYQHNPVVITKGGKEVAAVVDIDLFARIRLMRIEFDRLSKKLSGAFRNVEPEKVAALVDEAVSSERRKK